MKRFVFLCAVLLFMIQGIFVEAQTTRAEEIAKKKAEKMKSLHAPIPERADVVITRLTRPRRHWYPFFGSAFSGGGIALGPGFVQPFADNAVFDIHGAWSIENYRLVEASSKLPDLGSGRLRSD